MVEISLSGKSALDQFCVDLTARASEGLIDPVIGRDTEVQRIVQILCRRTKNNPILLGESGVGKTAIAEGLAIRIAQAEIPPFLLVCIFMHFCIFILIQFQSKWLCVSWVVLHKINQICHSIYRQNK